MSLSDRLKENWLVSVLLICVAVAGATWKMAHELLVEPREQRITQLQDDVRRLKEEVETAKAAPASVAARQVTQTLSINTGQVGTTTDGSCAIRVDNTTDSTASITVAIDDQPAKAIRSQNLGERIVLESKFKTYFIDLQRTRGGIVDLAVTSRTK